MTLGLSRYSTAVRSPSESRINRWRALYFSDAEQVPDSKSKRYRQHIVSRLTAKIAVSEYLTFNHGTQYPLKSILIKKKNTGRPYVEIRSKSRFQEKITKHLSLSITHTDEMVAVTVHEF